MAERPEVFLTGASGFVGGHVLRSLLDSGYRVRALVRPSSRPLPALTGCATVSGDLARPGDLVRAISGCQYIMHVAALYSFSPAHRQEIWDINVRGCAGLLEAARLAGVERGVVTSSSATVGPVVGSLVSTEDNWAQDVGRASAYHGSKLQQERTALAARLPVVVVLPTTPVGPRDWKPTPTGKMIVDFMRGRIFATLDGGMNVVPVEDIARAHVLALERGQVRERYLLGGENLLLDELWRQLAALTGRAAPACRIPYPLALALGWGDEIRCRLQRGGTPVVPLEGVHMGRQRMFVSWEKARRELGYEPGSVTAALERSVRWYREHGYAG